MVGPARRPDAREQTMTAATYLAGNFAPVATELTATDLEVTGAVPPDLAGKVLVLNGSFGAGSAVWSVETGATTTLAAKFRPKL